MSSLLVNIKNQNYMYGCCTLIFWLLLVQTKINKKINVKLT